MLVRMENHRNFNSLLVGMQNETATFEDSLAVSYNTKHILTTWYSNHASRYLPKDVENLCPHKSPHMHVYNSFIYNCQNLDATNMSFSRWMNK